MKPVCHIYLVRHGQTDWNAQGILQGQQDIELNAEGIAQAERLREELRETPFAACYASDLRRAQRTAEIIVELQGLEVRTHPQLRERYLARHEGQPYPKDKRHWELGPEAEKIDEVRERFRERLLTIAAAHLGQSVLVVAHSGPIRFFLGGEGILPEDTGHGHPALQNGSVTVIACDGEQFEIERIVAPSDELRAAE